MKVAFGYPRISGLSPALKKAIAVFPDNGAADHLACAKARADDENVVVEVGPIFSRDPAHAREKLTVKQPLQ